MAQAPFVPRPEPQLPRYANVKSPAEDPTSWNSVFFDTKRPPGKWRVTGMRERHIDNPKKKGENPNVLIDQGIAPGEVDFEVETYTGEQLRDLQDFYEQYLSPDRPLARANVTMVAHPALQMRGVKLVYGFRASFPEPRGYKGDVPVVSKFTAKVFNQKTRIGSTQGSRKPKPAAAAGGNATSTRLDVLVGAVQAGTFGLFGTLIESEDIQGLLRTAGVSVDDVALQAPTTTSPVILPYKDATALSILTGSIPDTMVTDVAAARAPR